MQRTFWDKLKSRKLWLAIIGAAAGIAIALGADAGVVETVSGAAVALVSVVAYVITEGKVDKASVELGADFVNKVLDAIEAIKAADSAVPIEVNREANES